MGLSDRNKVHRVWKEFLQALQGMSYMPLVDRTGMPVKQVLE